MISRIRAIFFRYLYELPSFDMMSGLFFWPIIDLLLWGLAMVWLQRQEHNPQLPQLILTALVLFQVFLRGAVDLAYFMLLECWGRNLIMIFATPLRLFEWLIATLLLTLIKLLILLTVSSSAAYLLSGVNVFAVGTPFIFYTLSLLTSGWALGMVIASIILLMGQKISMLAWLAPGFFSPLSAVFYPVSSLPEWVQLISWSLPMTYIFESMRQQLTNRTFFLTDLTHNLLLNTLYFAAAAAIFKIAFERSRARGLNRLE